MAYGLYLYKEIESKSGKTIRLEIFQKDYSGSSIEIESMSGVPLTLVSDNANSGVYLPIVKSFLNINIIDTEQIDYSVFFTPDATKFKVLLKVNGTLEWSGYLTPDSFSQSLQYKSEINLVARDNLGMLSEFDFDLTNTFYSISTLINTALTRIGFQFTLEIRTTKIDSANETIVNGLTQSKFWVGKNWQEVLETILTGIGCQLRYVGGNKYAIFDIGNLSSLGTTEVAQPFVFIEQSGIQEIVPAWKIITINQDYGKGDNSYDGFIEEASFEFDSNKGGDENNPYNFYTRPYYTISLSNDWVSTIPMLSPYEYPNLDPNDIYITGKSPATTLFMGQDLTYGKYFEAINDGKAIQFKFKASNYPYYITRRRSGEYMVEPMLRARYLYEMKVRCNLFAETATDKYVLQGRNWIIWTNEYSDALEFTLPQTKESGVFGKKGTELTSQMDSPQEQDITIEAYGLGVNARVYIEFYPYTATYTEVDGLGNVDDYPAIVYDVHTMKLSSFEVRIVENEFGGLETKATLNADHNINGGIELALGQVPRGLGGYNTYLGGIFKNSNPYYPPMYDFHFTGGVNYTLSELVGREIAHHYKTQRKKLSGNIINSENFAAMPSFAKPFTDGTLTYALNYGSLDFQNEVMQVELIEVEDYETEDYTFIEATIDTGGTSLGSGETEFIQWSAAGNAKRIYELDTASTEDTAGSYAVIDKLGLSAAKKVPLFTLLDQKENLLPTTPSDPESKFLNGNKEWSLINLGSGGNSPKVFFTSIDSDVSGYKELSYAPEATTSYCTTILTNEEELCNTFLYPLGVGVELLDAGTWEFDIYAKVSGTAGNVTMRAEVFKRTTGGVETTLFSKSSDVINNTDYEYVKFIYTSPSIAVNSTDRIGVRIYGKNTIAAAITLTWALGDGDASFFVTPLAMRHAQLRGKNDEAGFQHITEGNQTFSGIKTFSGAFTDMVENRNTNLRVPKSAPTTATTDEFYLYALDSGFSGETPSGAGTLTSVALTMPTGFSVSGSPITESGTFGVTFASGYFLPTTTQFASKLDVSLKGSANGLAELDATGRVPSTQLPSYVDDVIEVANYAALPVTGESGKIYITIDTNLTYRWTGTGYAEISQSLALGETSSTAYRGDRGKTAYDHSQITSGNPHGTTAADVGALALTGGTITGAYNALKIKRNSSNPALISYENTVGVLGLIGVNTSSQPIFLMPDLVTTYNFWHSGNSNLNSVDWTAAKLSSTTLLLPQVEPTLASGEMAIYGLESGFSGETPSGAGSVTSISMIVPTGLSVTPATITESGTFTISYTSGYSIPTNTKQSEWDNAYTLRHNAVTLGTANGLSLSAQELSLGLASTTTNGALSSTDWNTFNGKQAKLIGTGASSLVRVNTLGAIAYDDSTYLTGNQTITLSGIITGSGTTAITTAIADGALSIAKTNGLQTALDGKLSTTGKAADSDLLDGHDSTYFQVALTNPVTGPGTSGYLPRFTGASTIGNSSIYSDGTNACVGSVILRKKFHIDSDVSDYALKVSGEIDIATHFTGIVFGLSGYATTYEKAAIMVRGTSGEVQPEMHFLLNNTADGSNAAFSDAALSLYPNKTATFYGAVTIPENINTNLRIPKVAPTSPTSGEYYFYIVE